MYEKDILPHPSARLNSLQGTTTNSGFRVSVGPCNRKRESGNGKKQWSKRRRCHCTARSGCNHFRYFPPQSGFVQRPDRPSAPTAGNRRTDYRRSDQKHFLTPRTTRYQEFCNRHFGESGVYHPPTDLSGQPRTNRISAYGIRTAKESLCRTSGFAEEVPAKQSGLSFDEKPSGCCRRTTFAFGRESGNTASGWHPAASGSKSSYQRICGQCSYEHGKVHQSGRSSLRSD